MRAEGQRDLCGVQEADAEEKEGGEEAEH
jgi:hypothetical protein